MEVLFIVGLFQSLFFAIFLLTKQENKKANILLGIWLVFLAFYFLEMWVNIAGAYQDNPNLIGIFSGVSLLYGPFLLLYTLFLTHYRQQWKAIDWLNFIPFFLYYIFYFVSFFSLEEVTKIAIMENILKGNIPFDIQIKAFVTAIHGMIYSLATLYFLSRYKLRIQENFSNTDKISLQWLRNLSYGFLVIYTLAFFVQLSSFFGSYIGEGLVGLAGVFLIFLVAFMGLRQGSIFFNIENPAEKPDSKSNTKYLHSRMDEKDIHQIKAQILKIFEAQKPYLDPEFRLSQLAETMKIHPNELSQVINEGFQQNFYTLINSYRIEEVKKNLRDPQNDHLTLLAVGLQSGFNSKTTFNTVFKKMTGLTPSQFKKEGTSLSA